MISYEELDRALARWKGRAKGVVVDAPRESDATPLPIRAEELGSIPNAVSPITGERTGEIDVKEIGLDETHVLRNTGRKRRSEIAIEFDGNDLASTLRQRGSQRTAARADLDECLVAVWRDGCNQSRDPGWFEEVLTESLPSPRERSNPRSRTPGPGCASAPQSSSSTSVSPRQ